MDLKRGLVASYTLGIGGLLVGARSLGSTLVGGVLVVLVVSAVWTWRRQ